MSVRKALCAVPLCTCSRQPHLSHQRMSDLQASTLRLCACVHSAAAGAQTMLHAQHTLRHASQLHRLNKMSPGNLTHESTLHTSGAMLGVTVAVTRGSRSYQKMKCNGHCIAGIGVCQSTVIPREQGASQSARYRCWCTVLWCCLWHHAEQQLCNPGPSNN
jgi:hypothetical protein